MKCWLAIQLSLTQSLSISRFLFPLSLSLTQKMGVRVYVYLISLMWEIAECLKPMLQNVFLFFQFIQIKFVVCLWMWVAMVATSAFVPHYLNVWLATHTVHFPCVWFTHRFSNWLFHMKNTYGTDLVFTCHSIHVRHGYHIIMHGHQQNTTKK